MGKPKIKTRDRPKNSVPVLKIFIIATLTVVSITIILVIGINAYQSSKQASKIDAAATAAKAKVSTARTNAEPKAESYLSAEVNALKRAGIIDKLLASSKVDECNTDHNDQGWFTVSWEQTCSLHYVQGYTTNVSMPVAQQVIISIAPNFGEKAYTTSYLHEVYPCTLAAPGEGVNRGALITYRLAYSPIDDPHANNCGIPDTGQNFVSNNQSSAQLGLGSYSAKIYKVFNPHGVPNDTNQVWLNYDYSYYDENIGCGVGSFCPDPRSKPVQAP